MWGKMLKVSGCGWFSGAGARQPGNATMVDQLVHRGLTRGRRRPGRYHDDPLETSQLLERLEHDHHLSRRASSGRR